MSMSSMHLQNIVGGWYFKNIYLSMSRMHQQNIVGGWYFMNIFYKRKRWMVNPCPSYKISEKTKIINLYSIISCFQYQVNPFMSETYMDFSVSYINIYNFGTKLPKLMKTDSLCQKLAQSCPIIQWFHESKKRSKFAENRVKD